MLNFFSTCRARLMSDARNFLILFLIGQVFETCCKCIICVGHLQLTWPSIKSRVSDIYTDITNVEFLSVRHDMAIKVFKTRMSTCFVLKTLMLFKIKFSCTAKLRRNDNDN